jgi:phenylacetate-CoA ligase
LGDYIELEDEDYRCSCGLMHRVIKSVKGRVGSTIHGQTKIYPSLTWYYIFKNLAENGLTLNYQVIQIEKGKVLIRCSEELTHQERERLQIEFEKYFQNDLTFTLEEKYDFVLGKEKKKFFISKIDE